jgi:hypothetical protein
MMRQSNTAVDVTRRSPSYEVRLAKYPSRGFEIYIAELKRSQIDPTVCQVYLFQVAVCLCSHPSSMSVTLAASKVSHASLPLRNLPLLNPATSIYNGAAPYVVGLHQVVVSCHVIDGGRRYKGDLKADVVFSGLELSDYDIVNLHIPYGPGWDARRIERLVYNTVRSPHCSKVPLLILSRRFLVPIVSNPLRCLDSYRECDSSV